MMASLQANSNLTSISRTRVCGEAKLIMYPVTTLFRHKRFCYDKFKVTSLSESNSGGGSALVQRRPPKKDEEIDDREIMIDRMAEVDESGTEFGDGKEIEYLVKDYGWTVRRMVDNKSEIRKVADIQAEAFHVPGPFFDDFFFHLFKAEVLSGLYYRLRNSPPDRYACLVAEPAIEDNTSPMSSQQHQLVGVVDVTVLRDIDVIQELDEGAQEYVYVSGIAVSNDYRRQKVATVLLQACEVISFLWGHEYLVLRAHEDDLGARTLYTNAGYRLVGKDPFWVTWIGRKRRILMAKRLR